MEHKEFYSRKNNDGTRFQTTYEHIKNVAELAEKYGDKFGFSETAKLAATYHDIGKLSETFLNYLQDEKSKRGTVIHSAQGAKYIFENLPELERVTATFAALAVCGHHGGLSDLISPDGNTPFLSKLDKDGEDLHYDEVISNFNEIFSDNDISVPKCNDELNLFLEKCEKCNLYKLFALHMLAKLIYSTTVDADRYDAYLFEINEEPVIGKIPDWSSLLSNLENSLSGMNSDTEINAVRKSVSEQCLKEAEREQGVYRLLLPTGGGKTLSGLRFALKHAEKHKLRHIIYVIPYLSILEQTVKELREKLELDENDDILLEHHSSIISTEKDNGSEHQLLTSRWENPIIVTTMVQFLNSIFSDRAGDLRKLHNMTESVIIFDEIQNLPVKCVYLFNEAINFFTAFARDTVVLCSATQPILHKTNFFPLKLGDNSSIIDDKTIKSFECLRRTKAVYCKEEEYGIKDCETLGNFIIEKQETEKSILVIVNTRKIAESLFRIIKKSGIHVYHLSTNMCQAHRIEVLELLKRDLSEKIPVICISTQLIEAGVDISFGCVIRSLAGLDSIAQAAGRCNRHGEFGETKTVYVVNLEDEDLSKLEDIKIGANLSKEIFCEMENSDDDNVLSETVMNEFYHRYFHKIKSKFCYKLKNGTDIFDMISVNERGCGALENKIGEEEFYEIEEKLGICFAFETAGRNFNVIDRNTKDVIVAGYNKDSRKLSEKYNTADLKEKKKILRELGKYSVSVWEYQCDILYKKNAINLLENGMYILADGFYNEHTGLDTDGTQQFLNVG